MTLEEYKSDIRALRAESHSFSGKPEEAAEFMNKLSEKYAEACQFNEKAMECKDLTEFKALADSVGMNFSSDESAEKLFARLQTSKAGVAQARQTQENGAELDEDMLEFVTGGGPVGALVFGVFGTVAGGVAGIVAAIKDGKSGKEFAEYVGQGAAVGAAAGATVGLLMPSM